MTAPSHFGHDHARSYDAGLTKIAPVLDALAFLTSTVLSDLRSDARILCVGVGTGTELIALARVFPRWRFTAIDPSAAMLDICRSKTQEQGIGSRCEFHEGYVHSLPHTEPFDGATSILQYQGTIRRAQTAVRGRS
jgi:tRNA (cmo5U34)-methyltransferase